ncbi:MAG: acyl-CoA synthetase [Hyphomicrobiales bacterium]|nr:acyl-CoA synthetase [Hyphomicrobiales bacterium]MCP5371718.1 acyl-CoA synthetase [Hyphomicrobiales bacterium]
MTQREKYATLDDKARIEETPIEAHTLPNTVFDMLTATARAFPDRPALSFQIKSGPKDPAETVTWRALMAEVTKAANLFRRLGVGPTDVVAYLLPNCNETVYALLGGMTAGIVNPISPLLEPGQIAAILRETRAKVLVTLAPFPKTDVSERAARAAALAPELTFILEVNLNRYMTAPLKWIVPMVRPKRVGGHDVVVMDFNQQRAGEHSHSLNFEPPSDPEAVGALFHTGGTTGMPKIARHTHRGIVYNGWVSKFILFDEGDVLICPLPLFHVFAAYPVLMSCIASGGHMVLPTPAGYRGEGVFDNFWKLIERWKVSFMITVPTAISALMQRPVDADVSTLRRAICGSAPLPTELFKSFEEATGVRILEGYGMTEATCLISLNPPDGERKIGSVGLPFPYSHVRILDCAEDGTVIRECGTEEVGEICVANPGVFPGYTQTDRNGGLFAEGKWLRTGDLGRLDGDRYLWITGRAKDLIIRGGLNIDPIVIEEALAAHPAVAFVGAIGQPDDHAGELPCAYVELREDVAVTEEELLRFADQNITKKSACPKYVEILPELPKTAVGKIFKPDLRKRAIARVYAEALAQAGIEATVEVVEDERLGLVAEIAGETDAERLNTALGHFHRPWRFTGAA